METINEMHDAVHELLKRQENFSEDNFKQFVSVNKDCLIKVLFLLQHK